MHGVDTGAAPARALAADTSAAAVAGVSSSGLLAAPHDRAGNFNFAEQVGCAMLQGLEFADDRKLMPVCLLDEKSVRTRQKIGVGLVGIREMK